MSSDTERLSPLLLPPTTTTEAPLTTATPTTNEDPPPATTFYVMRGDTLCAVSRTPRGWQCRSTHPRMNHDYVAHEHLQEVLDWFHIDLPRATITRDRADALRLLEGTPESRTSLCGNPAHSVSERAERALQHLERGW